jgi:hypothetical protein
MLSWEAKWKKEDVTCFKELSQYVPRRTEGRDEEL